MADALADRATSALTRARTLYRQPRSRSRHFDKWLFAEPRWDILLDLFIACEENRAITVSSACIGTAVPHATALRYLARLERGGLVERLPHPTDLRCQRVGITERAREAMHALLKDFG